MTITAINAECRFTGKIKAIIAGDVMSEAEIETRNGIVNSVISNSSIRNPGLDVGSEAADIVKASAVSLVEL